MSKSKSLKIIEKRRSTGYQQVNLYYALNSNNNSNTPKGYNSILLHEESNILDLVNVKFKFECINDYKIKAYISSMLKNTEKDTIEIHVQCKEPVYSEKWICKDGWSEFKYIVEKSYTSSYESVFGHIFNITINVSKIEQIILCPQFYKDTDFTDFHLRAEDGSVAVHKIFLSGLGDVFKAMLKGKWKETVEGCLELKGATRQTLLHLKDYMYLNTLPEDGLQQLLLLAMYYIIDDLKTKCIIKLSKTVTTDNFYSLLEFAFENNIQDLTFAILTNMSENIVYDAYEKMKNPQVPELEEKK